ncbi:MAG TPA: hypothetical protein VG815_12435 [Chloroflexota bacterium]|jgi:hypothetical protein|nr:hypothetical protein [Chloroflexota bacterium]
MQTVLSCEHCHKSDFAPFLLLAHKDVDTASERLWLQCLNCRDLRVISVDADVQSQLVDLVEDDEEEIRSSDA